MIDDDDIPEDVKRGVETFMYGRPLVTPTVAVKRRRTKGRKPGETPAQFIRRREREEREKKGS